MALCPNCYGILNLWNVKAECPHCGINIPNHNWEGRLDEDAKNAEIAWVKFRKFTGNFKSALFGNKLRIIRFACTFLPLIALLLPLADYTINIPFFGREDAAFSLLDFALNKFSNINIGALLTLTSFNNLGTPIAMTLMSIVLVYLAVVFGVLNFFFVIIRAPSLRATANIVLCILSDICFAGAGVLFTVGINMVNATSSPVISGSVQFGLFVGIALFTLNIVLNIVVHKSMKKQRAEQIPTKET